MRNEFRVRIHVNDKQCAQIVKYVLESNLNFFSFVCVHIFICKEKTHLQLMTSISHWYKWQTKSNRQVDESERRRITVNIRHWIRLTAMRTHFICWYFSFDKFNSTERRRVKKKLVSFCRISCIYFSFWIATVILSANRIDLMYRFVRLESLDRVLISILLGLLRSSLDATRYERVSIHRNQLKWRTFIDANVEFNSTNYKLTAINHFGQPNFCFANRSWKHRERKVFILVAGFSFSCHSFDDQNI